MAAPDIAADSDPAATDIHNTVTSMQSGTILQAGRITGDIVVHAATRAETSAVPLPRQLPPCPPWFAGRAPELDVLDAVLNTEAEGTSVRLAAIVGTGGMGKTWLALHWAHRRLDRFPDGQLFIDLHGFVPVGEPMTVATAVRCLLDGLGVDHRTLPRDLDAQVGRFRSLVAGRRMLLLLDNAVDAGLVLTLLPGGASCTVLVTSRNRLDGLVARAGARRVVLGGLSDDEAKQVLTGRLGADRVDADVAAVDELLAYCAGMPLSLGIVVGRGLTEVDLPLSVLADELRDEATRVAAFDPGDESTSLEAVLSWSFHALPGRAAEVFRLLGLAGAVELGLPAVASLTGFSQADALGAVRALERASLVHRRTHHRWRMHDLVGLYAANRAVGLSPGEREGALRRLVDYYVHSGIAADGLLDPRRQALAVDAPAPGCLPDTAPDRAAAKAWFDGEHAGVLAAQAAAARRGAHRDVWRLAWVLHSYHWQNGHNLDQVSAWTAALTAAGQVDDTAGLVLAHRLLGAAMSRAGRPEDGLPHLERALSLAEQHGDRHSEAHVHRALARAWDQRSAYRKAFDHASRALGLYRELGQRAHEADALDLLCWIEAGAGHHDDARAHGLDALALYRELANTEGQATALDSLGNIAHRTGRHAEAVALYTRALDLMGGQNLFHRAGTLERLGEANAALADLTAATTAWRSALALHHVQHRAHDAARVQRLLDTAGGEA
ncbi:ATP-binding protein [Saccharothrix sp. NRRL B-16314]|uniref:ATP-binding protein n=1 Tax=Saccharothrix sp. NRRL B-16314 TaxID=1463825 RepID=UPI00068A3B9B|nr:tetratricopeptide repeat protein [Saccharothrix sp. NRRL B-16314]